MEHVINWLLTGDVAIQYLTHKRLLHSGPETLAPLQARIATYLIPEYYHESVVKDSFVTRTAPPVTHFS